MCPSSELIERADHLGRRVNGHPERAAQIVPELEAILQSCADPAALSAVVAGLGRAWSPEAARPVLPLAAHPDERVRLAVAQALPGGADASMAPQVAHALIGLTADPVGRRPRLDQGRGGAQPPPVRRR